MSNLPTVTVTIDQLPLATSVGASDEIELDQFPHTTNSSAKATIAQLLNGGAIVNVTTGYSVQPNDAYIRVDATGGNVSVQLPTAIGATGRNVTVKKIDSTGHTVTVTASSTIVGLAILTAPQQSAQYKACLDATTTAIWDQY